MMRSPVTWIVFTIVALLFTGRSAEAQTAKEIVQKAVDAHGGLDTMKKHTAGKMTTKGTVTAMDIEVIIAGEDTYQMPDQLKGVIKLEFGGQKIEIERIVNGGKSKLIVGGSPEPMSDAMKEELNTLMDAHVASEIYPLLDDKNFELSVIEKPAKVGDKEVVGVLVKNKAGKEFKLFFDAKTFTLLMMERKGLDFQEKEVVHETRMFDHKKVDGVLRPHKYELLFDGKKVADIDVVEYKRLDKVDPKEFDVSD